MGPGSAELGVPRSPAPRLTGAHAQNPGRTLSNRGCPAADGCPRRRRPGGGRGVHGERGGLQQPDHAGPGREHVGDARLRATKDYARITPDGTVDEFDAPTVTNPVGITAGPDDNLWVTLSRRRGQVLTGRSRTGATTTAIADIVTPVPSPSGPTATSGPRMPRSSRSRRRNPAGFTAVRRHRGGERPLDHVGHRRQPVGRRLRRQPGRAGHHRRGRDHLRHRRRVAGDRRRTQRSGRLQPAGHRPHLDRAVHPARGRRDRRRPPAPIPFGVTFGTDGAYWIAQFQTNNLVRLTTDGQATTLALPNLPAPGTSRPGPTTPCG